MHKRLLLTFLIFISCTALWPAVAKDPMFPEALSSLKNYQVNSPDTVSAGLPDKNHFKALKSIGVENVIDLIPGDRSEERQLTQSLDLNYYNVGVIWDNPTLKNFQDYVSIRQQTQKDGGVTLTHCQLNWRGAVFTYLYRVTQLNEPEESAIKDLQAIWQPNETWQAFIDEVKAHYQA